MIETFCPSCLDIDPLLATNTIEETCELCGHQLSHDDVDEAVQLSDELKEVRKLEHKTKAYRRMLEKAART